LKLFLVRVIYVIATIIVGLLTLFLAMKLVNIEGKTCKIDSDCIIYEKTCFVPCYSKKSSINNDFIATMNTESLISCSVIAPFQFLNNKLGGCERDPSVFDSVCVEKKCQLSLDCEETCKRARYVNFKGTLECDC